MPHTTAVRTPGVWLAARLGSMQRRLLCVASAYKAPARCCAQCSESNQCCLVSLPLAGRVSSGHLLGNPCARCIPNRAVCCGLVVLTPALLISSGCLALALLIPCAAPACSCAIHLLQGMASNRLCRRGPWQAAQTLSPTQHGIGATALLSPACPSFEQALCNSYSRWGPAVPIVWSWPPLSSTPQPCMHGDSTRMPGQHHGYRVLPGLRLVPMQSSWRALQQVSTLAAHCAYRTNCSCCHTVTVTLVVYGHHRIPPRSWLLPAGVLLQLGVIKLVLKQTREQVQRADDEPSLQLPYGACQMLLSAVPVHKTRDMPDTVPTALLAAGTL